jgi:cation diffusion facilitator CzcD-associated flavoprotein CzcO
MITSNTVDEVAIVGAGFSGLCMAIELKEAGMDSFTIYEKKEELGGTWRDNTYPQCGCDIPSHLYSFSFELNSRWSRSYSRQPEILEYIRDVAEKYDLYDHIQFDTKITELEFHRDDGEWSLGTGDGRSFRAGSTVLAVGPLSRPMVPDFDGLEEFEGRAFHSARWPDDFDPEGKRIAVVGTGASSVQIVPGLAGDPEELHVFQRTAPWVLPRNDRSYSELEKRLFEWVPGLQKAYRAFLYGLFEMQAVGLVDQPRLMKAAEWFARRYINQQIDDPELRDKVTPDYTMGCKRILLSDTYYPALDRDDVELISGEVAEFGEQVVRISDSREREVDAVVFATGFHVTDFLSHFEVRGLEDRRLNKAWSDGAEAYKGISVNGFPNLFLMLGPNTGLGHNSMIFMMECQARWIRQALEELDERDARYLDVRPSVHRNFNDNLRERMDGTVWKSGCESWYLEDDGKNTTLWPGYTVDYWWKTRQFEESSYRFTW